MKIYINNNDVTNYILEDEGLEVSLERERATHERVVNDVVMTFSNISGYFTTLFDGAFSTSKYWVKVYSDTETKLDFYGLIDLKLVVYDAKNTSVTITAFSTEREFWERCKNIKLNRIYSFIDWGRIYISLETLINREFLRSRQDDLFTTISVEPELASKQIRFYSDLLLPVGVGSLGKYKDLDPETTLFDLFTAFCINYNAEFYIDNDTKTLHFRRRKSITSNYVLPIDDLLTEDGEINVKLIDDDKYDYVETLYRTPSLSSPLTFRERQPSGVAGLRVNHSYYYVIVYYVNDMAVGRGEPFEYIVNGQIWDGIRWQNYYTLDLNIPLVSSVVTEIEIYRAGGIYDLLYRRIKRMVYPFLPYIADGDSDEVLRDDPVNHPILTQDFNQLQSIWIGYNDETGLWRDTIFNNQNGANQPIGNIFQSIPRLKWFNSETNTIFEDPTYVYYFFGMEEDITFLKDTWRDLMTAKRRIECTINDLTLSIGDSIITRKLKLFPGIQPLKPFDTFRVTKVAKDLIKRESQIEGIAL